MNKEAPEIVRRRLRPEASCLALYTHIARITGLPYATVKMVVMSMKEVVYAQLLETGEYEMPFNIGRLCIVRLRGKSAPKNSLIVRTKAANQLKRMNQMHMNSHTDGDVMTLRYYPYKNSSYPYLFQRYLRVKSKAEFKKRLKDHLHSHENPSDLPYKADKIIAFSSYEALTHAKTK